jgi:hypothetical protein
MTLIKLCVHTFWNIPCWLLVKRIESIVSHLWILSILFQVLFLGSQWAYFCLIKEKERERKIKKLIEAKVTFIRATILSDIICCTVLLSVHSKKIQKQQVAGSSWKYNARERPPPFSLLLELPTNPGCPLLVSALLLQILLKRCQVLLALGYQRGHL